MEPETLIAPGREGAASPPPRKNLARRLIRGVGLVWSGLRQFFFGVLPAAGIAILIFMLVREVRKDDVEIAPISVPAHFATQGLTPETVAIRLLDALEATARGVVADAVDRPAAELAGSQPDFNVPIAGLSLRAAANLVRSVLGYPQRRITGEMVLEPNDRVGIRLRMQGFGQIVDLRDFPAAAPEAVLAAAAPEIWRAIEPRIYVWHLFQRGGNQAQLRLRLDALVGSGRLDPQALRTVEYVRARSLVASNRAEEAARIAETLIAADPAWPMGWHAKGIALVRLGRMDEALAAYRQGMASARGTTWLHQGLAELLRERGQHEAALEVLAEAKRIRLDDPGVWLEEAFTLAALSRGADAVAAAEHAVSLGTAPRSAYVALARALVVADRLPAAIEAADTAIRLSPNWGAPFTHKGDALFRLNDFEAALAAYEEGGRVDPAHANNHSGAGWTYRRLGRHDRSLAAFDRAIALRDRTGMFHGGRGLALESLGRDDEARAALQRARELGYRTRDVANALARLGVP